MNWFRLRWRYLCAMLALARAEFIELEAMRAEQRRCERAFKRVRDAA